MPTDGLSRHWHSLPPSGVPSRFHLATRFSAANWHKALAWYREGTCAAASPLGAADRLCHLARAVRLGEEHEAPTRTEDKSGAGAREEEDDEEDREGGARVK